MSIISGSAAISTTAAGSSDFYDFPIGQSLMFDKSGYLQRTVTNTPTTTLGFIISVWLKIFPDNTDQVILGQGNGSVDSLVLLQGADNIWYLDRPTNHTTTIEFRDPSAWYHLMVQVASDASTITKIYVNNVLVPNNGAMITANKVVLINNNTTHDEDGLISPPINVLCIGRNPYSTTSGLWEGYMANMEVLDTLDHDLGPGHFGETKNGVWIPKIFDGTSSTGGTTRPPFYGVNGFRLDFAYDASATTTIKDVAPLSTQGTGSFSGQTDAHTAENNFTAYGF